jgi:hypothetical protein
LAVGVEHNPDCISNAKVDADPAQQDRPDKIRTELTAKSQQPRAVLLRSATGAGAAALTIQLQGEILPAEPDFGQGGAAIVAG